MASEDRATERPEPDLFDRIRSEAQAAFALAMLDTNRDALSDEDRALADLGINAGIVGALAVMRRESPER